MTQQDTTAETDIRALIAAWADAARRHDMAGVLAHHDADIVMFDLPPPLQSRGMAEYQATWEQFFDHHTPSAPFDIETLDITAGEDVAFAFAIMRCGTDSGGFRFRLTVGLRKIDGQWRVTHEHHSEPSAG